MIYVASPYSANRFEKMIERFKSVEELTAKLLQDKVWCYSPIVHCHEIAKVHGLPTDHDYWMEYNYHVIDRADALVVHMQDGWDQSYGVGEEIKYALSKQIPVIYHNIDESIDHLIKRIKDHTQNEQRLLTNREVETINA